MIKLCQDRRGEQRELSYVGARAMLVYDLPLNEVVFDFYDRLKSVSKGYASFDYALQDYRTGDLVKMQVWSTRAGGRPIDAGAPHPRRSPRPRHGGKDEGADPTPFVPDPDPGGHWGKIIARETVRALRKDVTAK